MVPLLSPPVDASSVLLFWQPADDTPTDSAAPTSKANPRFIEPLLSRQRANPTRPATAEPPRCGACGHSNTSGSAVRTLLVSGAATAVRRSVLSFLAAN